MATSVASSVGGAVGGGAGGAAGGAAPLVFGVQRFSMMSGLAANTTEVQAGVTDGMSWSTGNFNWVSAPPPPADGRRLEESEVRPSQYWRLLNLLITTGALIHTPV